MKHSVLEQIWIKGSSLDQRLPQHESLYPIGLKLARIEILHSGFEFFSKCENSFTIITFKLILLSKKVPNV